MSTLVSTEAVTIPTGTWAVDPVHSSVGFAVTHLGVSTFRGTFGAFDGSLVTDEGAIVETEGTVQLESVAVGDEQLKGHLLSDDFFGADAFPAATFASTHAEQAPDGSVVLSGDLTLRAVTLPVTLTGSIQGVGPDAYGNIRLGLAATGTLDRTAYGVDWNVELDTGAPMLSESVALTFDVSAVLEGPA